MFAQRRLLPGGILYNLINIGFGDDNTRANNSIDQHF